MNYLKKKKPVFNKTSKITKKREIKNNKKEDKYDKKSFIWLKYNSFSCRYDSFFLIYTLVIKNCIQKLNFKSEITDIFNDISNQILLMDNSQLNNGIWDILANINNDKYKFNEEGFKLDYPISNLIGRLNNNNIFSFKIIKLLYCYKCNKKEKRDNYFGPIIQINQDDLNLSLSDCLYKRFRNEILICPSCGWRGEEIITSVATYTEIIDEILNPEFLFFFYDIGDISDNLIDVFNNIKNNLISITKQLTDNFSFQKDEYILRGLICCPYNGHFVALIINLENEFKTLKKGYSYFYDDCSLNHNLQNVDNFRNILSNYLPYVAIYKRK